MWNIWSREPSEQNKFLGFVSFVENTEFLDERQENFALQLIDTVFKEPLLAVILAAPEQYLTQVRSMLSSRKYTIQDLGATLLGLFPAKTVIEDTGFTKWLLLEVPARTLADVIRVLEECNEQLAWDWTDLYRNYRYIQSTPKA